jgi:hypothetical protein
MRIKFLLIPLGVLAIFIAFLAPNVLAVSPSSISVSINPPNPAPYASVTITLSSFAANLDSVNIVWLEDGKTVLSGVGKKSYSTTTKKENVETRIEARIFLPDGEINKNISIRPAVMVLLWQANDSYVPPFYKGKALPTADSEIKIVAMPEIVVNGSKVAPDKMTYNWKLDYNNQPNDSGYGKNAFVFTNDYLENSNTVSVVASTTNQQHSSEASINVTTVNPEISFYKRDATLGTLWEQALFNNYLIQGEEIVIAEPFFISPKNWRRPELIFNWSINNRSVVVPNYLKNLMSLKTAEGVTGTSILRLDIENTDKIFQTAKKEINIQF